MPLEPSTLAAQAKARKERAKNTTWSNEEIDLLVTKLLEAKDNSLNSENGFKACV
jgi:hypothetical protein